MKTDYELDSGAARIEDDASQGPSSRFSKRLKKSHIRLVASRGRPGKARYCVSRKRTYKERREITIHSVDETQGTEHCQKKRSSAHQQCKKKSNDAVRQTSKSTLPLDTVFPCWPRRIVRRHSKFHQKSKPLKSPPN